MRTENHEIPRDVDRLVFCGDAHSFMEPLRAFGAALEKLGGRQQVVFNGDLYGGGVEPAAAAAWMQAHAGELATLGNHDEDVLVWIENNSADTHLANTEAHAAQQLAPEQRDYMRDRPHRLNLTWRGRQIVILHGHFDANGEPASWTLTPAEQAARFADVDADLCVVNHTHVPYILEVNGSRVANPGSLAIPMLAIGRLNGPLAIHTGKAELTADDDRRPSFLSVTALNGSLETEIVYFDYDREAAVDTLAKANVEPRHLESMARLLRTGILQT